MPKPVERVFEANGARMNVSCWQNETSHEAPVVLLHGIWDTSKIFAALGEHLSQHRSVFAPDLRGHGKSDKHHQSYRYGDYGADVTMLLEQIATTPVDLFGYSFGTAIAVFVAKGTARVRKLVLEDPPLTPRPQARARAAAWLVLKRKPFAEVVDTMRKSFPARSTELLEENARTLVETADGALEAIANGDLDVDWPAMLADSDLPTLVLRADPSAGGLLDDQNSARLMQFLKKGKVLQFAGSGHCIHGEYPVPLAKAVDEYLLRG
ncbi:MAG: alpha/beta hydrolase [Polyangiales bacterium]